MPFKIAEARNELQAFDLKKLFIEQMGWDNPGSDIRIGFDGQTLKLKAIAQKRGLGAFVVPPIDGKIPDYATRRKIEMQVRKIIEQHVLIFTNQDESVLRWQWVRREPNKPTTAREFEFTKGKSGDALLQRLEKMYFSLEDEESISGITDATARVRSAFNVERVTRRFYDRFKDEHTEFLKFIRGIPDTDMLRWYVTVTMNRLMFIYFIQKKKFLDHDADYLRHHLEQSQKRGKDLFYRNFLCPLFFEGFARKNRSAEIKQLLGDIPYLNGGIFERHQVEELHGEKIEIPDKAFEQLFDFFDDYRWHLDERPNKDDREINPDVLGYIFEKYINQKQMGAYYTKEDITEYISKNTILPHLFDVAQKECKVAFEGEGSVWRHLQADPDRYIYTAVRHGIKTSEVFETSEVWDDLPAEIARGLDDPKQREGWNKPAPKEFALPTEIWREVVARRRRYQEVKEKLAGGEVTSINDLITLNLDIRQFAQDVIEDCEADLLLAFWKAMTQIKILDPTVGSGAFLFAALNVLEPLYAACLERMGTLVEEHERVGEVHSPKKYEPFRKALAQVHKRSNEEYYIFKSIIINNLYGVDIMEEAVEICKLRLFLKLAAQVEPDAAQENLGIEPLPDIDFNIRAGNTLVGFATREDVKRSVQSGTVDGVQSEKLFAMPEENAQLKRIEEKAADVDRLYKLFRQQQTEYGGEVRTEDKRELQKRLGELEAELNILLAKQYAIHNPKSEAYQKWLASHLPFHWFVEFYGIMNEGGFDVIIGNPPYVEYRKVKEEYTIQNYSTEVANNLYAFCIERSLVVLNNRGSFGMIVPVSSISGESYIPVFRQFSKRTSWISSYSNRPAKLFQGVEQRLTITISRKEEVFHTYSSPFQHWYESERDRLFPTLCYSESLIWGITGFPIKSGHVVLNSIFAKLMKMDNRRLSALEMPGILGVWVHNGPTYWVRALPFEPTENTNSERSNHYRRIDTKTKNRAYLIASLLNSSLYYFFFKMVSNCRDLGTKEWANFPVGIIENELENELVLLGKKLEEVLIATASKRSRQYPSGYIEYYEYYPARAKSAIDKIDRALALHYGLSDEELDFIINYDIKYRMGISAGEEEGGDDRT